MSDTTTNETSATGPGKVLLWLLLVLGFVRIGIAIYFMGPWLQDQLNLAPGADAGAPAKETATE